jgi:hypothetical protein
MEKYLMNLEKGVARQPITLAHHNVVVRAGNSPVFRARYESLVMNTLMNRAIRGRLSGARIADWDLLLNSPYESLINVPLLE